MQHATIMSQLGEFATDYEISVFATLFQCIVYVWTADYVDKNGILQTYSQPSWQPFRPLTGEQNPEVTLLLKLTRGNHYDVCLGPQED